MSSFRPPPTRVIIHSAFTIADFLFDEASLPQRKINGRPRWTACLRHVVAVAASPIENKFRSVQRGVLSRGLYGSYAFPRIRHREEKSPERELTSVPLIAELRDAPPSSSLPLPSFPFDIRSRFSSSSTKGRFFISEAPDIRQ